MEVFISCSSIVKFSYFLYPYLSHNLCIRDALSLVVTTPHDCHTATDHLVTRYLVWVVVCVIIILYHCVCGVRGPTGGHQLRAGAEHGAVCTVQPVQTGTVHCTHCTHGHQVDTIIAPIHIHNWQCSMCSSSSSHCYKSFVSFDRLTLICGQLLPWDRKKIINLIIMELLELQFV